MAIAGTITDINGKTIHLQLDGREGRRIAFDASEFKDFRHGYAGTIYKGQGRTLDQTYLYHSEHWRSAASYVALTRHRDKAEVFVARNTARRSERIGAADGARRQPKGRVALFSERGRPFRGGGVPDHCSPPLLGQARSEQPLATARESEPDSFESDLVSAQRAAAAETSKRQDHEVADRDVGHTEDGADKQRSRDRGGGRSL